MAIRGFNQISPKIDPSAYVDDMALVIGDVRIGSNSSVWPMTVVRGDVNSITIGEMSNIQDGCVLHVTHKSEHRPEGYPLTIGDRVTIGHKVILHGCRIEDECLIGMGATVMDNVTVPKHTMIGAGSLVPPGKQLESGYLYVGSPVKRVRPLTEEEKAYFTYSAEHYQRLMQQHQSAD
ncbi:MAG: gamma carbonic anhydrase family protein [Gammaproteobacteria bacterium]|nr:gamma carbonic anhydrase family protein [Gammaproteobacteria bacterium]